MTDPLNAGEAQPAQHNNPPAALNMDVLIRFSLIVLLALWCFEIVKPFLIPVLWALIIAVAFSPLHARVARLLGKRKGLAAFLLAASMISALVIPATILGSSSLHTIEEPLRHIQDGSFQLKPLPDELRSAPFIGEKLSNFWDAASEDLPGTLGKYQSYVMSIAGWLTATLAGTLGSLLKTIFSIVVAGIFWVNSEVLIRGCYHLSERLFGKGGSQYITLTAATITSVAQGVIGVALIQTILAGIGLAVIGAPFIGLWMLLVLIVAVAQLPPIIVLGPVAAYMYSVETTTAASIFLVYCLIVSSSDALLKPLLLGRGLATPMIIILMGAIGGMIAAGILGLFVGAVTLGTMYHITQKWALNQQA